MSDYLGQIGKLMVGPEPAATITQFAVLLVWTMCSIYLIVLFVRRGSVVVLSHGLIVGESLLLSLANLGFIKVLIRLMPNSVWRLLLFLVVLLIVGAFWTLALRVIAFAIDRRRSLKDLQRSESEAFNCNWPLIPRCANFALTMGILIAFIGKSAH